MAAPSEAPQEKYRHEEQQQPEDQEWRFLVRPRFGNRFYRRREVEPYYLSAIFRDICEPRTQRDALKALGINVVSKTKIRLELEEFPPSYKPKRHSVTSSPTTGQPGDSVMTLKRKLDTKERVPHPFNLTVGYDKDVYTESDVTFCCLLEGQSPFGEHYSVPVLGRGSFSLMGHQNGGHCISGVTASFLQRASIVCIVLIGLCELDDADYKAIVHFYKSVDRAFGYGCCDYIDFLARCAAENSNERDTFLHHMCLKYNNTMNRQRMPLALENFLITKTPSPEFYEEVQLVMTTEELDRDRQLHYSVRGQATQASLFFQQNFSDCCPCAIV